MLFPDPNKRIKDLIEYFSKGNVLAFTNMLNEKNKERQELKLSSQQINRLFNFETRAKEKKYPGVSSSIIEAIARALPEVNVIWLVLGTGQMLDAQNHPLSSGGSSSDKYTALLENNDRFFKRIVESNLQALLNNQDALRYQVKALSWYNSRVANSKDEKQTEADLVLISNKALEYAVAAGEDRNPLDANT